ncbi:MAG: Maf family protein [Methylococcaceae bacterium]|nr:Maf family protein [Methylococcaceae bacterium]
MNPSRILLASASPRRRELLAQIGIDFEVFAVAADETPRPNELPEHYVRRVAAEKSQLAMAIRGDRLPVLGADTEVSLDGEVLGKPSDFAHAREMLLRLSGREHQVLSAVSLRWGEEHREALNLSRVKFRRLTEAEIVAYWDSGEPWDKAGAYAIQGRGAVFIEHLSGSFSAVMGLPIYETAGLLQGFGIEVLPASLKR